MDPTTVDMLNVPGARLHYEVRGSGPVLLLIHGGIVDAGVYTGLAGVLADGYTVVTYDRRGYSRSSLDAPADDQRIEVHGDDAARLVAALGSEPAYVLGNSSGAVIALELATRRPDLVRAVVAHEPSIGELMPEPVRASLADVPEIYRREGVGAAMQKFLASAGLDDGGGPAPAGEPTPEMQEGMARMQRNVEFFLGHELAPFGTYMPDVAALRGGAPRVVVAAGAGSRGQTAHACAVALAERLGTGVVEFPGDHGGLMTHPGEFAAALRDVLAGS
jgi:pimeloyl-ACP methyl ester carboxylesterase